MMHRKKINLDHIIIAASMIILMCISAMLSYAVDDIKNIVDAPDPVNFFGSNITINATVKYTAGGGSGTTTLVVLYPVYEEELMTYVEDVTGMEKKYTVSYKPNQTGEYSYKIRATEDGAPTRESGTYTFDSAYFPFIESVTDTPDPIKYDAGNITIRANIYYWGNYAIDTAIVKFASPINDSIRMTNVSSFSGGYVFEAKFDPDNVTTYNYTIFANDTSGNSTYSSYYTFRSEGYPPQIANISRNPWVVIPGDEVIFGADVTDPRNRLDTVMLYIVSPVYMELKMNNITQSHFIVNYTTPIDIKGTYYYYIWANNTDGFTQTSGYQTFINNELFWDNATISVKISPACCGLFSFFYMPEKVIANQTLIILSIFENCGNVGLNETTNITIQKDIINEYGSINESKLVIIPPNLIRYWQGDSEYVTSTDDEPFFAIFYTTGLPLGNYTANTSAIFSTSTTIDENETFTCSDIVGLSKKFEIVEEVAKKISPVVIIREMPRQINQDTTACRADNMWNGSCTYTSIKLIVYNKGSETAQSLILNDAGQMSCSGGNCSALGYRCVDNPDVYTCNTNISASDPDIFSSVYFTLKDDLRPGKFAILEYELVPTNDSLFYDAPASNRYSFDANADFYYGPTNESYTAKEDHAIYNPSGANIMYLYNKSSFNYDLDSDPATANEDRELYTNTETTFYVTAISVSGGMSAKEPWNIKIMAPYSWNITSCQYVSGANCICSYNNTEKWIMCNGTTDMTNMQTSVFSFTANTQLQRDFLLPAYSNDSNAEYSMSENYLPGLFTISREMREIEVETPVPEPQPEPSPTPIPTPEPEPEPKPKIEIVLTPINSSYKAFQGQTIPTIFKIENIGMTPARNISIEPVLLPGWNYSKTWIEFLNASQTVNRTLLITPPEDATPGMYAIPVRAMVNNETADIAYIWFEVLKTIDFPKIRILEAPEFIEVNSLTNSTIPIVVENIGNVALHNVTLRIENAEECLSAWQTEEFSLNKSEIKHIDFRITTKEGPKTCRTNIIISSMENAYAFAPVKIIVKPKPPMIPFEKRLTPWIALLWTLLFVIYAIIRKRKTKHGDTPTSNKPRMILYMLLLGEVILMTYIILWYFGVIDMI